MLQSSSSEKILVKPLKIDILGLHGLCSKWKKKKKQKYIIQIISFQKTF